MFGSTDINTIENRSTNKEVSLDQTDLLNCDLTVALWYDNYENLFENVNEETGEYRVSG